MIIMPCGGLSRCETCNEGDNQPRFLSGVNSKGSALITVLILFSVMLVLGGALLQLSLIDSRITVKHEKNLTAYYYALSGVELALGVLKQAPAFQDGFSRDMEQGKTDVTVEHIAGENRGQWVKIHAAGNRGHVQESLFLQFKTVPSTPADALDAVSLEWIDADSGELLMDAAEQDDGAVAVYESAQAAHCCAHYAYRAPQVFFENVPSLFIEDCSVELSAETLVFRGEVILSGLDARLHLRGSGPEGIRVQFLQPVRNEQGAELVEAGTYVFSEEIVLEASTGVHDLQHKRTLSIIPGTKRWGPAHALP